MFEDIENICSPRKIFEFGFHAGHSTTYMLETFPGSTVDTCGLSSPTKVASVYMKNKYQDRINIFLQDSLTISLKKDYYDFAFVDGQHIHDYIVSDIGKTVEARIPFTLIDNCERKNVADVVDMFYNNENYQLVKTYEYYTAWNNNSQWNQVNLYRCIA